MKILFVSSEINPYASTGGLSDVVGALPVALQEQGVDVVRVMPLYRCIMEGDFPLRDTGRRLKIPVGLKTLQAEIWQSTDSRPTTYFVRKDEYFDRRELYSIPERDYDDNFDRFIFFQKAVVRLIDDLALHPDIIHANDWQTALIPYFLDHGVHGMGRGRSEKIVYTIHNLAYQGVFPDHEFPSTNLPFSCFSVGELEFYGNINCMKGAIIRSDRVTTVSKRYAAEILTPELGCGLEGVLGDARHKLSGIVNGVDYTTWDPASDHLISAQYTADTLNGKKECKKALLEKMGLTVPSQRQRIPCIGMVTRLVDQKGMDLLAEAMDRIMEQGVYFVLLGFGQEKYQQLCKRWAAKWPDRFGLDLGHNNQLAHEIEAGADIFMMPSRFEPCGLNQLYSLRYGTIPVVHATGGLDDTIVNIDAAGNTGNGFKFESYTVGALLKSFDEALALYKNPTAWEKIQQHAMRQDFSWKNSAADYISLYEGLLGGSETDPT